MQRCPALTFKGTQCGNPCQPDSDFCYTHRVRNPEDKPVGVKSRVTPLIEVEDVLKLQSLVLTQMGHKQSMSSKELLAFSSLSQNYIKNKQEADKMKRLDRLEAKTSHL